VLGLSGFVSSFAFAVTSEDDGGFADNRWIVLMSTGPFVVISFVGKVPELSEWLIDQFQLEAATVRESELVIVFVACVVGLLAVFRAIRAYFGMEQEFIRAMTTAKKFVAHVFALWTMCWAIVLLGSPHAFGYSPRIFSHPQIARLVWAREVLGASLVLLVFVSALRAAVSHGIPTACGFALIRYERRTSRHPIFDHAAVFVTAAANFLLSIASYLRIEVVVTIIFLSRVAREIVKQAKETLFCMAMLRVVGKTLTLCVSALAVGWLTVRVAPLVLASLESDKWIIAYSPDDWAATLRVGLGVLAGITAVAVAVKVCWSPSDFGKSVFASLLVLIAWVAASTALHLGVWFGILPITGFQGAGFFVCGIAVLVAIGVVYWVLQHRNINPTSTGPVDRRPG
jgi:hypothetical protein